MSVTIASFRETFPAFTDPGTYTDDAITLFLNLSVAFQNLNRWDPLVVDYGTQLFIAHHLVLDARNNATVGAGGIPGTVEGVRTAKSVDKVAISYDANSVTLKDAAFWNMTTYGIRFWQLVRTYGAGGFQVGAGPAGCFRFSGGWF